MKKAQELLKEIMEITYTLENEYPELYKYLDENPVTIPIVQHPNLNNKVFADYLTDLKTLLNNHIETHKNNSLK